MNRTIIERVRYMLSEVKLPKQFWGEALLTTMHVINLSLVVARNFKVPDKIWFGKNVTYDYLCVFDCKAFVHVPEDERSKLDVKTRQHIFIGFCQDEFGYKLYDPVEKKVVRSRDVQFMEDKTIQDIDKVEKSTPKEDGNVVDVDPILLSINILDIDVHNDEQHGDTDNQQVGDGLDVPIDNVDEEEHDVSQDESLSDVLELPEAQPRRSDKPKQLSKKYSTNEYVMLTDEGEPRCYKEAIESEEKQKWLDAMQDEMKSLHDNHTYDLVSCLRVREP
ncbi:hypothetical protein V8G54_031625 [Vigna mungo]|uniref:Retroviral polymerase SH3-like domain-containing protein n=1 Tax=Vigna mungo TaxID=3915 RepID=A0AAQ3MK06_VIGMU